MGYFVFFLMIRRSSLHIRELALCDKSYKYFNCLSTLLMVLFGGGQCKMFPHPRVLNIIIFFYYIYWGHWLLRYVSFERTILSPVHRTVYVLTARSLICHHVRIWSPLPSSSPHPSFLLVTTTLSVSMRLSAA